MKPLLAGIAIIIILLFMLVFQIDNYNCRLQTDFLKYCADEASNSASLMYDEIEYNRGNKIFTEEEGIKSIEKIIKYYLKTDDNLVPLSNSYWKDKITYTAYFFDDDLECRVYKDGIYDSSFNFTYPYLYTDEDLNYNKSIGTANVIVTINAGRGTYSLIFLNDPIIVRSSGYEYEI